MAEYLEPEVSASWMRSGYAVDEGSLVVYGGDWSRLEIPQMPDLEERRRIYQ